MRACSARRSLRVLNVGETVDVPGFDGNVVAPRTRGRPAHVGDRDGLWERLAVDVVESELRRANRRTLCVLQGPGGGHCTAGDLRHSPRSVMVCVLSCM